MSKYKSIRNCKKCLLEFKIESSSQYYCLKCKKITFSCECGCGGQITFMSWTTKEIRFIHGHNRAKPEYRNGSKCTICEKSIDSRKRVCSKECHAENSRQEIINRWDTGQYKARPTGIKRVVLCAICYKQVNKHQRKTCSRECFSELNRRLSVERYRSGEANIITGHTGVKGHYYKDLYLRSSWELEFAKYMDSLGIIYEYEKHRIDLGDCVYIPDFYIPKFDMFIEIKGWAKPVFLEKMNKFDKLYPALNLLVIQRPPPYNWVFE